MNDVRSWQICVNDDNVCESIWICIVTTVGNLIVGNVYRPPSVNTNNFITNLENTVLRRKSFVIVGDFNISPKYSRVFQNFLDRNNLKQHVGNPTYFRRNFGSTLDLCVSDIRDTIDVRVGPSIGSDHLPVIVSWHVAQPSTKDRKVVKYLRRKYCKSAEYSNAVEDLCNRFCTNTAGGCNELWQAFTDGFLAIVEKFFPMRKVEFRHSSKVPLPADILKCIERRTKLYKMARVTRARQAWDAYYDYKKDVDSMMKRHKAAAFQQAVQNAGSMSQRWRILRTAIKGRKKASSRSDISSQDFVNAFKQKTDSVTKGMPSRIVDADFLQYITAFSGTGLQWPSVGSADVALAISRCASRAANLDSVAVDSILDCADKLSPALANLISVSLEAGIYPDVLKISKILPIHKGGSLDEPANYRPISIGSVFAKIFDTFVLKHITGFFTDANDLLSSTQYGFRSGRSTTTACVDLTEFILSELDNGRTVCSVFLDVSNAFPSVNHHILVSKMHRYGF